MRKYVPSIFLQWICVFLLNNLCHAQFPASVADSLQRLLQLKPDKDSNRVNILLNLSHSMLYEKPDSSMKIAAQALELSQQLKWQKGIALALRQKGLVYYFQSDFVNAIEFSQEALKAAATLHNKLLSTSIYNNIANVYADMGQQEKALDYYKKLLTAAQESKHKVYEMNALVNMGLVYLEQNNFPAALSNLRKGLDIAVANNNISISAAIYNNMGIAYKNMNRMPEALQYLQKSVHLAKQSNNHNALATSLNEVAKLYILMKEYKKA